MTRKRGAGPPLLVHKHYDKGSVFAPENLMREARRQKNIPEGQVPQICVLDPDGDIVRNLLSANRSRLNPHWACYHTRLYDFECEGIGLGVIGCAVGAPFAVLVAEELFASGCRLLVSITSSGQILPKGTPPYFVLIEKALRDEGASYHYLPPSDYSFAEADLIDMFDGVFDGLPVPVYRGASWTTDAPFRETAPAIAHARKRGLLAVEMEAAALYAFAAARRKPVVCFAHVTNRMGRVEGDFEKGIGEGSEGALRIIGATATTWLSRNQG